MPIRSAATLAALILLTLAAASKAQSILLDEQFGSASGPYAFGPSPCVPPRCVDDGIVSVGSGWSYANARSDQLSTNCNRVEIANGAARLWTTNNNGSGGYPAFFAAIPSEPDSWRLTTRVRVDAAGSARPVPACYVNLEQTGGSQPCAASPLFPGDVGVVGFTTGTAQVLSLRDPSGSTSTGYTISLGQWHTIELTSTSCGSELRAWPDGGARPAQPLAAGAPLGAARRVLFSGPNFQDFDYSVDYVLVEDIPIPFDVELESIDAPVSALTCDGLTSSEPVTVTVRNHSVADVPAGTPIVMSYDLDDGLAPPINVAEVYVGGIAACSSIQYTFATTADLSSLAVYGLTATVLLAGDADPANDSLVDAVTAGVLCLTRVGPGASAQMCLGESLQLTAYYQTDEIVPGTAGIIWSSDHPDVVVSGAGLITSPGTLPASMDYDAVITASLGGQSADFTVTLADCTPTAPGAGDISDPSMPPVTPSAPASQEPLIQSTVGCGFVDGCTCPEEVDSDALPDPNRTDGGASVLLHSGQELRVDVDLFIRGRDGATPLVIKRRHMSRVDYVDSIFGPAWAFNYRQVIREQPGGDIVMESFGRFDRFVPGALADTWEGTEGRRGVLRWDGGTATFTLRSPHGTRLEFATQIPGGLRVGVVTSITSPNVANRLSFAYDATEPDILKRKLTVITDSFGRDVELFYGGDPDYPDGVHRILDFSGREVLYDYDPSGRLVGRRSPTVTGTPGGLNDFPSGKTRRYAYANPDPMFPNLITSVTAPREVASGGESRLAWTYYQTGPFRGWVETHTVGNPTAASVAPAGGTYSYGYTLLHDSGTGVPGPNDPVVQASVTDRRGTSTTMDFNHLGNVLAEMVEDNPSIPGPATDWFRVLTYNGDGDLVRSVNALGDTTVRSHVDPGSYPRTSHAVETERLRIPDGRGGHQTSIREVVIHEPVYNKPFKVVGPRGYEAGNTPDDYTTTYVYDYMEDLGAAAAIFAPRLGVDQPTLLSLFASLGITSTGDVNADGDVGQRCGNLVRIVHPTVTLPAQATRVLPSTTQTAEEIYQYNAYGQLTLRRDAEGNVTEYEFHPGADPDGNGTVDDPTGDPVTGGYLREVRRDTQTASGRNGGHDPSPVVEVVSFEYSAQAGGLPENLRGVPTAMLDGRRIKHTYHVNELDQVLLRVRAADVGAAPEPGLSAPAYQTLHLYDENDNLVEERVQNSDTLDPAPANDHVVHQYAYDVLDQLVEERLDVGGVGIETRYEYDASQNRTRVIRGANHVHATGPDERAEAVRVYDERDILVSHTRGANDGEASTMSTEIDLNGNVTAWIDAEGGDRIEIARDGYDRPVELTDRVGNRTAMTYDSASRVTLLQRFGPAEPGGSETLLAATSTGFDERRRPFRTDRHLFHYAGRSVGAIDAGAGSSGPGLVTSFAIRDRLGRVVGRIDADDDTFETRYDGLSRTIRRIDPLGNDSEFIYDQNHNLTVVIETETSPFVPADELFYHLFRYDALDRRVEAIEPNGQTTAFDYDSRDNLIRTRDHLGNEVGFVHDRIDRELESRTYLSPSGASGSPSNLDAGQGGGDGIITVSQGWDDLNRLVSRTDDRGNETRTYFDDLDRQVRHEYADGTFETRSYDRDSQLTTHVNQNGSVMTWMHDAAGRPTRVTADNTSATTTVVGTTEQTWAYDGLDRIVMTTDDNGTGDDVTCVRWFDSLSRRIRERQTVGSRSTLDVDTAWQGSRRPVSHTYPDGRIVRRTYDALDRLSLINEGLGVLARFQYVGPSRDLSVQLGNGTLVSKQDPTTLGTTFGANPGYDGNRRHLRHVWKKSSPSTVIASFVNTYHDAGAGTGLGVNRRSSETRAHLDRADSYTFDGAYRMTGFDRSVDSTGAPLSSSLATLDGVDRMTSFSDEGTPRNPVVDGDPAEAGVNQYSSFGGITRAYDDNGNLADDGSFRYVHDFSNRIIEIRRAGDDSRVARYAYDASGRRVLRALDQPSLSPTAGALGFAPREIAVRYVYDGWRVLEERDGAGRLLRQYVDGRGLDEHCQLAVHDPENPGAPASVYYYNLSSQGFVGALSDSNQDVVEYYEYGWLGRPRILAPDGTTERSRSVVGNAYMFQGRRYDPETESAGRAGLYWFRHRYYDPNTGEFVTIDPLGNWQHGQGNGYSAFSQDGWSRSDPMGLDDSKDPVEDLRLRITLLVEDIHHLSHEVRAILELERKQRESEAESLEQSSEPRRRLLEALQEIRLHHRLSCLLEEEERLRYLAALRLIARNKALQPLYEQQREDEKELQRVLAEADEAWRKIMEEYEKNRPLPRPKYTPPPIDPDKLPTPEEREQRKKKQRAKRAARRAARKAKEASSAGEGN